MASLDILVADDEPVSRRVVSAMLERAGFSVRSVVDGSEALSLLLSDRPPPMALLDWMMPGLDGPEVVRRLREREQGTPSYIILLTSRGDTSDIVAGLRAGANDYVTKPAHEDELLARVGVGVRVAELQRTLADRVRHLEDALRNVKQLQGLLPICSYCKAIRNDQNYWQRVENYLHEHSGVQFSHSYCPSCYERHVRPQLDALDVPGPRGRETP